MKITQLFKEFYESEKAGGLILVFCTVVSLVLANTALQENYLGFWHTRVGGLTIEHWINDGLMALFFLLIGLELERELYLGELNSLKNALLPIIAAIGGMVFPAGFYLLFNLGTPTQSGTGIPTATDIAFALGILSLLGRKVPTSLKVFLTALAVIDDLGAILIIAVFYTKTLTISNLIIALLIFSALIVLNRMKIRNLLPYLLGGIAMWFFMSKSGIHATITGVLLAFVVPFGKGGKHSPSYILQHYLHKPVAFIILPVFALANTAIIIGANWVDNFREPYSLGILTGLIIGKPLGISLFSFIAVVLGLGILPDDMNWKHLLGAGFLAGIGFTMSIFITLLAFDQADVINNSKFIILTSSLVAGSVGYFILKLTLKQDVAEESSE
ncbi:MAG TPA: Na+/H+ antiporter NhaA [Bacteroidales bacterium]|nr:Na+/H+ antiporter NhaA [Bacteroidales bacterium]